MAERWRSKETWIGIALGLLAIVGLYLFEHRTAARPRTPPPEIPPRALPEDVVPAVKDVPALEAPAVQRAEAAEGAPAALPGVRLAPVPPAPPLRAGDAGIAGWVLDDRLAPVDGAEVFARGRRTRNAHSARVSAGGFALEGLAPDAYTLGVVHGGRRHRLLARVEIGPGERVSGVELVLPARVRLDGLVVDAALLGLPGFEVTAVRVWPGPLQPSPTALSGADGSFRFEDLTRGVWELRVASQHGMQAQRMELHLFGDTPALELMLEPGAWLSGEVRRADGALQGFHLEVFRDGERLTEVRHLRGTRYRTEALPPGPVELRVVGLMDRLAWRGRAVLEGGETVRDIVLEPGARVEGRVVDEDGRPVEPPDLYVQAGGRLAEVGAGGRFVLDGLPAGSTALTIPAGGPAFLSAPHRLELAPGEQRTDVVLRARRASFLALRIEGPPGAALTYGYRWSSASEAGGGGGSSSGGRDDELLLCFPGDVAVSLRATAAGGRVGLASHALRAGETTRVTLRLEPAVSVVGEVTSPIARRVAALDVGTGHIEYAPLSLHGSFELLLPPGEWSLYAVGHSMGGRAVTVQVEEGALPDAVVLGFP